MGKVGCHANQKNTSPLIQTSTDQFFASYNGRRYNTLEMTVCQVVYVSRVEIKRSSQGASLVAAGLTELPSCPVCLERLVSE